MTFTSFALLGHCVRKVRNVNEVTFWLSLAGSRERKTERERASKLNKQSSLGFMKSKEMEFLISVILLFVGIAVLVIIHVCIAGRAVRGGNQGDNMGQRSGNGTKRMSTGDLERLPCFDYKAAEKGSGSVDCAVCLENFKMGDKCRLLPNCRHSFHVQCIDSWLLKTPICPICRTWVNPPKIDVILREESRVELT